MNFGSDDGGGAMRKGGGRSMDGISDARGNSVELSSTHSGCCCNQER